MAKSRFVIEIETKNIKEFLPEEGANPKDYTKKQLEECKKDVEEGLHKGIRLAFKDIFEDSDKHYFKESKRKVMDVIEEVTFENGDIWESPEAESFDDIGEISFKVIEEKKKGGKPNSSQA